MTLENHYIVCGFGRMGRQIVHDLKAREESFVVVENGPIAGRGTCGRK